MIKINDLKEWLKFLVEHPVVCLLVVVFILIIGFIVFPYCSSFFSEKGKQGANITKSSLKDPIQKNDYNQQGGIFLKSNKFINNGVGVSMPKDANIKMDDNTFSGNGEAIEVRDK